MSVNSNGGPSIEKRLRRLIIVGVGGVLLIACLLLEYVVEKRLIGEYDRALAAKARALVTLTKQFGAEVELDFADEFMPEFEAPENPEYFQLWFEDGSILERSRSLRSGDLPRGAHRESGQWFSNLALPDGRKGRAVEIVFLAQIEDKEDLSPSIVPPQQKIILVVARERESLLHSLLAVRLSLMAAIVVMIAIIVAVVKIAVRKGLQPLHEVRAQLDLLNADQLGSRLAVKSPPRELTPLIEQFNELLDRLQKSFQREQRFSSDVAHELRTPVAELRNLAEIAIRWPEDKKTLENFFQDVFDISLKMQRTITNLLALARCEDGKIELAYQEVNLSGLIGEAWLRVAQEAGESQLTFDQINSGCNCLTSVHEMELILNNLFSNAVAHSRTGTAISASISRHNGSTSFTISNIAKDLVRSDLDVMFDRLWRKDPSRSGDRHIGLGLSLVKAYAQMLDLTTTTELNDQGLFSISIGGLRTKHTSSREI